MTRTEIVADFLRPQLFLQKEGWAERVAAAVVAEYRPGRRDRDLFAPHRIVNAAERERACRLFDAHHIEPLL